MDWMVEIKSLVVVCAYIFVFCPLLSRYVKRVFLEGKIMNAQQRSAIFFLEIVLGVLLIAIPSSLYVFLSVLVGLFWYVAFANPWAMAFLAKKLGREELSGGLWMVLSLSVLMILISIIFLGIR